MNKTIYRQYDSRWSGLPYPYGNSTLYGCGCGCLAVLHCLLEIPKYKKYTPKNIQPYMKQFAVYGKGTLWSGITTSLKHYGLKSVINHPTMSQLWKELDKGNRVGVLLFGSRRGPDGTVWTTGGHFIAYTGYKVKNGKHYLYLKDSGSRKHDGWYCYERSMQGDIVQVWSAELPEQTKTEAKKETIKASTYKPTTLYTGTLPKTDIIKGDKGDDVKALQNFLNWCIDAKLNGKGVAGDKTVTAIKVFQKTYKLDVDGNFGSLSRAKAKEIVDSFKSKKKKSKKKKTTQTKAEKINQTALEFAWPKGIEASVYKYPSGSANPAFKKAWKKYYPKKKNHAGCHEFVMLVLKANGYPTIPLNWKDILTYFKKYFQGIKVNYKETQIQPGDIRIRCRKDSKGKLHYHIWIEGSKDGEKLLRIEANYKKKYAHVASSNADTFKKHYKDWLFRAK